MAVCSAIARSGERCKGVAIDDSGLCYAHHPDHADERRRAARKGGKRAGRGRPLAEVAEIQGQLSDLYTSVLTGLIDPKVGAVLAQIANARARILETGLKAKEQQELEARLEELEAALEARQTKEAGGYGYTG